MTEEPEENQPARQGSQGPQRQEANERNTHEVGQHDVSSDSAQGWEKVYQEQIEAYSGPIPHPALLERFDEIVPGSARQIVDDAHEQSRHRRSPENKQLNAAISHYKRGQIFGFILAVMAIGGGIWLISTGEGGRGLAAIIAALAALAAVFITNEWKNRASSTNKAGQQSEETVPDTTQGDTGE